MLELLKSLIDAGFTGFKYDEDNNVLLLMQNIPVAVVRDDTVFISPTISVALYQKILSALDKVDVSDKPLKNLTYRGDSADDLFDMRKY